MENWKDIPGYEGLYQVSDLGRVRSVDRMVSHRKILMCLKGRIISMMKNERGYYSVGLCKGSVRKFYPLSRVVALAFLGPSDLFVDHINNNPSDNRLCNLQYLTPRQNTVKAYLLRDKTSKFTNVSIERRIKSKSRFLAKIYWNKRPVFLGYHKTEEDANNAVINFVSTNSKQI